MEQKQLLKAVDEGRADQIFFTDAADGQPPFKVVGKDEQAGSGWTDIFIYPGYQFQVLDALITNFHLPESTLVYTGRSAGSPPYGD